MRLGKSSFRRLEVFEDCSGGNSRLSYLLGCGGRSFFDQEAVRFGGCSGEEQPPSIRVRVASYFFDQKIGVQQRPHCRDRTVMRFFALNKPIHVVAFSLDASALNAVILLVRLSIDVNSYATSGIFFRFQVTDFDFRFAFFSLCHFDFLTIYFGFFVWVVSLTPKSTWCPPSTSFSGMRSLRRINLSLVRLRLLPSDSAAGAFFFVFDVLTLALCYIRICAKFAAGGQKQRCPMRYLSSYRRLCRQLFLQSPK